MADKRIDQLTAATTMGDDDLLVLQQNNQAKKLSGATLSDYIYDVVEVSNTQPAESRNKVWIKPSSEDLELAEMSDVAELKTAISEKINSLTVTENYNHAPVGFHAEEYDGIIKMYGTPTAARKIVCFNGNDVIASTTTSFVKTLDAGTYTFRVSVSGYQSAFVITATYTTFDDVFVVADNNSPEVTVTFNAPVMVGINANKNRNYGTSENPTYVTVVAEKMSAVDIVARNDIAEIQEILPNKLGYVRLLHNTDDLDEILDVGAYRWVTNDRPINSPTIATGVMLVYGTGSYVAQLIITQAGTIITRYHTSTGWGSFSSVNETLFLKKALAFTPEMWGLANMLANANQMMSIKWTPVGNLPKTVQNGTETPETVQFFAQTEQTGIPYSSVRDQDKAVGMDVSYHTFMTAVRDPNSVLYTRLSTVSNSTTYYGSVCSGLVNVATGINLDITNYYLSTSDLFETIPMQSIARGDMLWVDGHAALVDEVDNDEWGRINKVVVWEEWRPLPREVTYNSWNAFITARSGYIARRFKGKDGVTYTPIPYVQNFDEVASEITYPDIQTEFGDAAVFMKGEDVKVNVIDSTGYTSITVTRGSTQIYTSSTIEGFTLENVQAGLHTITATGNGKTSTSTFFVVDATASFNDTTGAVTFSSTNATPVMVGVYKLPSNREVEVKDIILSDAEKTAGTINVLSYMDSDYKYAKVWFMTDYGTAVWYSETHDKWTPLS